MENAAERYSFASYIYNLGAEKVKKEILNTLPSQYSDMHKKASIHIHDLEAFGKVNNCSTPDLYAYLSKKKYICAKPLRIVEVFENIKELIQNLAKCQSGGIGFANIDKDIAQIFDLLEVEFNENNISLLRNMTKLFIKWANEDRTRLCRENYYTTFNLGLDTSLWGREVSKAFLEEFEKSNVHYVKPNIVFKVNSKINSRPHTTNYDLFRLAMRCTAKRMIPTYLLTDSYTNKLCNPEKLNIMGCRTRVYDNTCGEVGSIGRGNIGCVSVNLPRLALEAGDTNIFYKKLSSVMNACMDILVLRKRCMLTGNGEFQSYLFTEGIWGKANSIDDILKEGTYSIGFIGLSETVELLTGKKVYECKEAEKLGLQIVGFMRSCTDEYKEKYNLNISLLATPGEMISGRFAEADAELLPKKMREKGFYTNSFHVDVDSQISVMEKIRLEGSYHKLCNGGSITYIEFNSACLGNIDAIEDSLKYAEIAGISYIGFNYPLDICEDCGYTGTYDTCPVCASARVKRIRRVSGYLEDASYFSQGKKREIVYRKANKK